MQHIKVTFRTSLQQTKDMLMALLSDIGYDGFEETDQALFAYIGQDVYDESELNDRISALDITYDIEVIPAQNWNALWESNFQPVIVDNFCTIRAHFHDIEVVTPYDIIITPKMSFGTGHHATTQLVIMQMEEIDFLGKAVLDFGTGTGVLAILAEMKGAMQVVGLDNDEWSIENARENVVRNDCKKITIRNEPIESIPDSTFDIILANINRHILLQYMDNLYRKLKISGIIVMSGLLTEDKDTITEAATKNGLHFVKFTEQNNWISIYFCK